MVTRMVVNLCTCMTTEVFSRGVWTVLDTLKDPELQRLAHALPRTVLASRADSTTTKYLYSFRRWKLWAEAKEGINVFPAQDMQFALYLQHLAESTASKAAVEEAVNAISWAHQLAGMAPITTAPFVRTVLAGLQRQLAKPIQKKEPITAEMLSAMVKNAGSSLSDVRLCAMALLAFSAFLRAEELTKIRCCDIVFSADSMQVKIPKSKTDQYRDGASVLVARTNSPTCPVAMLERYYAMASLEQSSSAYVFRGIVSTKSGERLRKSGKISYTRVRELMLSKIASLGYDASKFGMHSFRAGGATAAANAGIKDRLFKRHGRWRSETAKDGYVKDSIDSRMSVSKSLKL